MLEGWNLAHLMAKRKVNTMALVPWGYLPYLRRKAIFCIGAMPLDRRYTLFVALKEYEAEKLKLGRTHIV